VDVSQVDKYEMSTEDYETRRGAIGCADLFSLIWHLDTVLTYKKNHKMGRFAPATEEAKEVEIPTIDIGSRCQVQLAEDGLRKRGAVRFVGSTKFAGGPWVGIEYDEPLGKNDGS
jgi:hypothetical protein